MVAVLIVTLTLGEWRWMISREKQLQVLVKERTLELEAEKCELLRLKAALVRLASHDSLTGLYNRGAILELLEHQIKTARQQQCSFAVVLLDLDDFKSINDIHGHLIGDEVLREFARRVQRNLRPCDHVGRYGGEELLIVMPGMKDEAAARIKALHERVTEELFAFEGFTLRVTCSFGVSWSPPAWNSVESLVGLADKALYAAKANGRNRVELAEQVYLPQSPPRGVPIEDRSSKSRISGGATWL
jgi:diguanylate cyclase (GGDEF)-like protein